MKLKEYYERRLSLNKDGLILDEDGNEYRGENGVERLEDPPEVSANVFIKWYFADTMTKFNNIATIIDELTDKDSTVTITMQKLFDNCGFIPADITNRATEGYDGFLPSECKLI